MALTLEELKAPGYEQVVYATDPTVGLQAIVAIHNTNRGPSCGGTRMLPYASKAEATKDVLNLSKGMSYKSALAGIGFGGGKSVIILDPQKKTDALFHAFGEFVDTFQGRYIAAKDMNVSSKDLMTIKTRTKHVLGIEGEKGSSGDPSPVTARGNFRALEATVEHLTGSRDLLGIKVAIQGIGYVGFDYAEKIVDAGGQIWVHDINEAAMRKAQQQLGAHIVSEDGIYDLDVDVFSPCARGGILNSQTIERLKCKAIAGCANNQLATSQDGFRLHERGILYAPDYAINSGGIINIFVELDGYDQNRALKMADDIYDTAKEIFRRAKEAKTAPFVIADKLAEERLRERA